MKAQYDVKAKNIIVFTFILYGFCRFSICKTAKEMWKVLGLTYEGTYEVKRVRNNIFIKKYMRCSG